MGLISSFGRSYVTSLFIIWEIVLLILDGLKNVSLVNDFRTVLWVNQGYLVILAPLTVIEICYDILMIRNNNEFWMKIKDNKLQKYSLFIILGMLIATDYILFKVGILEILADQHPVVIQDPKNFHFGTTMAALIIYSAIPIAHYVTLWAWKCSLKVKNDFNHNRFRIDLTRPSFSICMVFSIALVIVIIQNYIEKLIGN